MVALCKLQTGPSLFLACVYAWLCLGWRKETVGILTISKLIFYLVITKNQESAQTNTAKDNLSKAHWSHQQFPVLLRLLFGWRTVWKLIRGMCRFSSSWTEKLRETHPAGFDSHRQTSSCLCDGWYRIQSYYMWACELHHIHRSSC